MTNEDSGPGRDMTKAWEGRSRAAARRRARLAADELARTPEDLWPPHARAVLTEAGATALETIDRVDPNAR